MLNEQYGDGFAEFLLYLVLPDERYSGNNIKIKNTLTKAEVSH